MRLIGLFASLLALVGAMLLLVADSMPPCGSFAEARSDYDYVLSCDGEVLEEGSVSFSNEQRNARWSDFAVEDPEDAGHEGDDGKLEEPLAPGEQEPCPYDGEPASFAVERFGRDAGDPQLDLKDEPALPGIKAGLYLEEDEPLVSFFVVRASHNLDDCTPGSGVGVLEHATAEAEAVLDKDTLLFNCEIYPQADEVTCLSGPYDWSHPDDDFEQPEPEAGAACTLVLTAKSPVEK